MDVDPSPARVRPERVRPSQRDHREYIVQTNRSLREHRNELTEITRQIFFNRSGLGTLNHFLEGYREASDPSTLQMYQYFRGEISRTEGRNPPRAYQTKIELNKFLEKHEGLRFLEKKNNDLMKWSAEYFASLRDHHEIELRDRNDRDQQLTHRQEQVQRQIETTERELSDQLAQYLHNYGQTATNEIHEFMNQHDSTQGA